MEVPAQARPRPDGGRVLSVAGFLESRSGRLLLAAGRLVFWIMAAAVIVALARRGLTLGDEGYLLSQASDIVQGDHGYDWPEVAVGR